MGRRKTIVLSMFSASVTMLFLSQARSLSGIVVLSCPAGLTGELYRPASSALLADLVPQGQPVTAFAAYRMAFNARFAFGPATAAADFLQWIPGCPLRASNHICHQAVPNPSRHRVRLSPDWRWVCFQCDGKNDSAAVPDDVHHHAWRNDSDAFDWSFRSGDLAPAHQRGLYMGAYGLIWSIAFVCGPSLGLLLFSVSPPILWMTCGVLGLLAAAIITD
jgi:MFS family permease